MKQVDLFDICAANHGGNENSVEAHNSIKRGQAQEMRRRVLAFIQMRGAEGATCEECETALRMSHQTASARCSELKRDGLVHEAGSRKTRTGRNAAVLKAGAKLFWRDE